MTNDALKRRDWDMLERECLGLVPLEFGWVVRVVLEITRHPRGPGESAQVGQIAKETCVYKVGVPIGEDERDPIVPQ